MRSEAHKPVSFRFCAMQYLNVWFGYDRNFVEGLRPERSTHERVRTLREAATFYRIARNFKTFSDERTRERVLRALDGTSGGNFDVDDAVETLACELAKCCGKQLTSAASKLLWFRRRSPIVIFDWLAVLGLRTGPDAKQPPRFDYRTYRKEWRRQFERERERVSAASHALTRVRDFSLGYSESQQSLASIVAKPWFHERVFDQFLWWTGKKREDFQGNPRFSS